MFLSEGPDLTDITRCTSIGEFKVKPNKIYMLFTDLVQLGLKPVPHAPGSAANKPLRFEAVRPCVRRCFHVKLRHADMELVVGTQVSVSMLLRLGFLEFEEIHVTREVWVDILKSNPPKRKITTTTTAEKSTEPTPSKQSRTTTVVVVVDAAAADGNKSA